MRSRTLRVRQMGSATHGWPPEADDFSRAMQRIGVGRAAERELHASLAVGDEHVLASNRGIPEKRHELEHLVKIDLLPGPGMPDDSCA